MSEIITERDVKAFLIDWRYYLKEIIRLQEELLSCGVKVTVTYEDGSRGGGSVSSSVERCVIKREKIERELSRLMDTTEKYITAINHCGLSKTEREVIKCITNQKKLIQYAEENGIYWTYVYKIKNRAVHKITRYINNTKNTKRGKEWVKS